MQHPSTDSLARLVRDGDARGLARALSVVENGGPGAAALLHELFDPARTAGTVGITGPPGAGKSSILDLLITRWRKAGRRPGVIAVDPTSPFSGGALLGDRLRMQGHACDPDVFIRSMGSRGHIGGLSATASQASEVLASAGFDPVVLETVGVGQGEVEVASVADVTILVLVPGLGDDIQMMKAGIMEIGDLIVLNKADRPGIDQLEATVRAGLEFVPPGAVAPPVFKCSAMTGEGFDGFFAELEKMLESMHASDDARRRRIRGAILRLTAEQGARSALEQLEKGIGIDRAVEMVMRGETTPYELGGRMARTGERAVAEGDD